MRYLLVTCLIFPYLGYAQLENFILEKGQVYFQKTYQLDSMNSNKVERALTLNVPKLKDVFDFSKAGDVITAKIKDATIDYKKYGGKWGNTSAFLNHPFFGDVSIVWKDNKYRVSVNNIYFNVAGFGIIKCSDFFTKNKGEEFNSTKIFLSSVQYMDRHLSELFMVDVKNNEDW